MGPARMGPARLGTTGRRAGPKQASCPGIGPRHVPWADFRAGLARQARDQTPGGPKARHQKTSQHISKKFQISNLDMNYSHFICIQSTKANTPKSKRPKPPKPLRQTE